MNIAKLLSVAGIILIIGGILGSFVGWRSIDHESYQLAKEVYEGLSDNEFAEASYNTAKSIWVSQISILFTSVLGSVIGGLVLLGFGKMLELQQILVNGLSKENSNQIAG